MAFCGSIRDRVFYFKKKANCKPERGKFMKVKTKRLLSFMLALCLLMTSLSISNVSAKTTEISKDIVLILDASGSMSGKALSALKDAANAFCEKVLDKTKKTQIGLVAINSSSKKLIDLTDDLTELSKVINGISDSGGTNIYNAMDIANEMLSSSDADEQDLVIMTDGLPQSGQSKTTGKYISSDSAYYRWANSCIEFSETLKKNYDIYTVGFFHNSSAADAAFGERFLRDLASAGFYTATNMDELIEIFEGIAQNIVTPKDPQTLKLNINSSTKIVVGNTKKVTVKGNKTPITFESSDDSIATIDDKGVITGVSAGTVDITVVAEETDKYAQAWETVTIEVVPKGTGLTGVTSDANYLYLNLKKTDDSDITGYRVQFKLFGITKSIKIKSKAKLNIKIKKSKYTDILDKVLGDGLKIRICSYKTDERTTYYGSYSKWKSVTD